MAGAKYSKRQKEQFFDLIDKGGTVRGCCKVSGCAPWGCLHMAAQRRADDATSHAEDLLGCREGGVLPAPRGTEERVCRGSRARVHPGDLLCVGTQSRGLHERGQEGESTQGRVLAPSGRGPHPAEAAARVNADKRSAIDWDKGITIVHRGRIYPDGRIVRYPEPTLKGMTPPRTSRAIGGRVDLDRVEKVIHARYLSLVEREQLRDLCRAGRSMRQIAAELGRSPSTISRELRRNTVSNREYLPHTAHRLSVRKAQAAPNPQGPCQRRASLLCRGKTEEAVVTSPDQPQNDERLPRCSGDAREH